MTAHRPDLLHVPSLNPGRPHEFDIRPDADARAALAQELGIDAVRKLRLAGRLTAEGGKSWRLVATLGATVVQPCVVTLEPVTTRIDTDVARFFVPAHKIDPVTAGETEMPEDDSVEPLGTEIDLAAIMAEALSLALPTYPRADGALLQDAQAAPDGAAPIDDTKPKPFAALAGLRDKLAKDAQDD